MRSEIAAALLAALVTSTGCADLARGPTPTNIPPPDFDGSEPVEDGGGGGGAIGFSEVHPLLLQDCQSCHSTAGVAGSTNLVYSGALDPDLLQTLRFVDESRPAESRLLSRARGEGHGGGALWPLGSTEHTRVLDWISQGALP